MNRRLKKFFDHLLFLYVPLFCIIFFILIPMLWTVITSFKLDRDIITLPVKYMPDPATLKNYSYAWINGKYSQFFFNTFFVATVTVIIVIFFSIFLAYALSRFQFAGKKGVTVMLLATQLIPGVMLIIPLFVIFNNLGLISTLTALIIIFVAFDLPFNSLLMKNFVDNVPFSIEESAMVDGCGRMGIIFRVIMPQLVPGMIAVGAFSFFASWNEFLLPLIIMNRPEKFTLSIGLTYMIGAYSTKYGALAAGSIISLMFPLILFGFIQKYLVQGLGAGAVKG